MDAYPDVYLDEPCPLVVLSGLSDASVDGNDEPILPRNGARLDGQQPLLLPEDASRILSLFQRVVSSSGSSRHQGTKNGPHMQFQACARDYSFPTRKSSPQATPAGVSIDQSTYSAPNSELHSPLSPLSPGSPLYPDGLMTPLWMHKHRSMVPAQILSFFPLSSEKGKQTIHDNDLKAEINNIKSRLDDSKFRTRYAVVVVGRESYEDNAALEERLGIIKRTVKLDSRTPTLFYVSTLDDDKDMTATIRSICDALWPSVSEYYRDLTRHARRKRDRSNAPVSSPPATPGISQNLTRPGWNARYEFKLGVFAEFRREPDVAARHYSTALDHIFHPAGFFEVVNSWSPRWNEARTLADVIAIRLLRCQLISGLPTSTVIFWKSYRSRVAEVLQRNGKGTNTYGWHAWEARWSQIMGELAQGFGPSSPGTAVKSEGAENPPAEVWSTVYLPPEKQFQTEEPVHPWELLHHAGYWFGVALGYVRSRRRLACNIPQSDRLSAGQSPAASVARRAEIYDTYLCPEPDVESKGLDSDESIHDLVSVRLLHEAVRSFSAHNQLRMASTYKVALGKQLLAIKSREEAIQVLKSVWKENDWRKAKWTVLVKDLTLVLHVCAREIRDIEAQIATLWELLDARLPFVDGIDYDLPKLIKQIDKPGTKILLDGSRIGSFLDVYCVFERPQGHAGEAVPLRIIVHSHARSSSNPVVISSLVLGFEGVLERIVINHDSSQKEHADASSSQTLHVDLEDISGSLKKIAGSTFQGSADIAIGPGQTKVLLTSVIPRDAGRVFFQSCMARMQASDSRVDYSSPAPSSIPTSMGRLLPVLRSPSSRLGELEVLPRPPKLDIDLSGLEKVYYTDETCSIPIRLRNDEDQAIRVEVELRLVGSDEDGFTTQWQDNEDVNDKPVTDCLSWSVGKMTAGDVSTRLLSMQVPSVTADTAVEVTAKYFLANDPSTPVTKIATSDAIVVRPFEANYSMRPLLHPTPWPNFFTPGAISTGAAAGVTSRWVVTASMVSFASQEVTIDNVKLETFSVTTDAQVSVLNSEEGGAHSNLVLSPKQQISLAFTIDAQKQEPDERKTITCSAKLVISWRRASASKKSKATISALEVGKLGFASAEPRVLCTRLEQPNHQQAGVPVQFTIENPSMHYLSFSVGMAASGSFAFSGPKSTKINLLPMSRQAVEYRILPTGDEDAEGEASTPRHVPLSMSVVDVYFNKRLEVMAAGSGVQEEEDGSVAVLV